VWILKQQAEEQIQGLTTAAGLWLTVAIGVAVGLGRETSAVLGTGLALVILALLPRVGPRANAPEPPQEPPGAPRADAVRSQDT
jgi:putative Mg2+ transporter-C (MgtC) family protein